MTFFSNKMRDFNRNDWKIFNIGSFWDQMYCKMLLGKFFYLAGLDQMDPMGWEKLLVCLTFEGRLDFTTLVRALGVSEETAFQTALHILRQRLEEDAPSENDLRQLFVPQDESVSVERRDLIPGS
jgi:hypothetical protein